MRTLTIVILTLFVYSIISTTIYLLSKQNEDVLEVFGLGIFGMILVGISKLYWNIKQFFRCNYQKRTLFQDNKTKTIYKCKNKDTHNIYWGDYKLIKRYTKKNEWKDIPDLPDDVMKKLKINCENCIYNKDCEKNVKCKHDNYGTVIEFDQFKKK